MTKKAIDMILNHCDNCWFSLSSCEIQCSLEVDILTVNIHIVFEEEFNQTFI